jgi:hypothetical protein
LEDPTPFDLWAAVSPDKTPLAIELLQRAWPNASRLSVLKAVRRSAFDPSFIPVSNMLGWGESQALKRDWEEVGQVRIYQSGYGPTDEQRLHHCDEHQLFYGGIFGCHVHRGHHRP